MGRAAPFDRKSVGFGLARLSVITGIPVQAFLDPSLTELELAYLVINAADVYGEK